MLALPLGAGACGDGATPARHLVTATAAGGGGCALVEAKAGQAWSDEGVVVVPDGAEMLVIGTRSASDNPDLQGASITLTSPDGTKTVRLADGHITASGFASVDLATPASDPALTAWMDDVLLLDLPADPTPEDWEEVLLRARGYDPEHPLADLPAEVQHAIDDGQAELLAQRGAIIAGSDSAKPSDGFVVLGPDAGSWTLAVDVSASAPAIASLLWVIPAGADATVADAVGHALAGTTAAESGALAHVARAIGNGEGEDPGGAWHLEQFRFPPPSHAWEFYRAQVFDVSYKVVVWLVLRGFFTKAIDVVLKLEGTTALLAAGVTKDRLKTLSIFVVSTIYKEILRYSSVPELWFWRAAYTLHDVPGYFQLFHLGKSVPAGPLERVSFGLQPIALGLNAFEEIHLAGGNMTQDLIARDMWGNSDPNTSPKVARWSLAPAALAKVKPSGQQDGDCTVESVLGQTTPGTGKLTVVVATQPAKVVVPVTVEAELALRPLAGRVDAGGALTLTVEGLEGLTDPTVFAWSTDGAAGELEDAHGHHGKAFESPDAVVTYNAASDAVGGTIDGVDVTAFLEDGHVRLGAASATVTIAPLAPCKVTISVYDAPAEWVPSDGTPADITCELGGGTYVIDPASLAGCMTSAACHLQCLGWEEPAPAAFGIAWHTFDADGNATGGNACGSVWYSADSCQGHVDWLKRACAEGRCGDQGCSACNCGCGGGNCYPWHGPGTIVFDAVVNLPCTDAARCYYDHMPGHAAGSYSFELVSCASVDDALPGCPGYVPE
ncbi:MAG: hypothetical protein U1F43_34965 [Myxococcota bacterium]